MVILWCNFFDTFPKSTTSTTKGGQNKFDKYIYVDRTFPHNEIKEDATGYKVNVDLIFDFTHFKKILILMQVGQR